MNQALIAFKKFYEDFSEESLQNLQSIYSEQVIFSDPVHTIHGLKALNRYFEELCGNLTQCQFEFIDEVIQPGHASFKWKMHYRHPKIKSNSLLKLNGASFIEFSEKVDVHEDFYDMGAMLYEHVPLMGGAIRLLKSKITAGVAKHA